jgi:hypothetical protein
VKRSTVAAAQATVPAILGRRLRAARADFHAALKGPKSTGRCRLGRARRRPENAAAGDLGRAQPGRFIGC